MSQNDKNTSKFSLTSLLMAIGFLSTANAQDEEVEGGFFDSK